MIPGRRLPTSTAELYAIGLGSGPPLLFLHGVTANCVAWLPVMELLQDSYTVTAVDQRGHGPVVVVRHSLGARNAIAAAARRPTG
jgi:2-(acetamidomethylene)succinate hydrolase